MKNQKRDTEGVTCVACKWLSSSKLKGRYLPKEKAFEYYVVKICTEKTMVGTTASHHPLYHKGFPIPSDVLEGKKLRMERCPVPQPGQQDLFTQNGGTE